MGSVGIISFREIWAAGLAALVTELGYDLAGRWRDADAAAPRLQAKAPDILILSGVDASRFASTDFAFNGMSVVLIIDRGQEPSGELLCRLPVKGIIECNASAATIEACLKSVAAGNVWVDPELCRAMTAPADHSALNWASLTARELEIAKLASRGLSNKRIAQLLRLSDGTIKIHMHHIFAKLRVSHRTDLTNVIALQQGVARSMDRGPDKVFVI